MAKENGGLLEEGNSDLYEKVEIKVPSTRRSEFRSWIPGKKREVRNFVVWKILSMLRRGIKETLV